MNFGENLKRIRKSKGLTQKQLGEKLGISQAAIGQFESDKANPKIETIEKIANVLEVPILQLTNITLNEFKPLQEYKKSILKFNARESILAILADLYGNAERKEMYDADIDPYYIIGKKPDVFFLHENDLDILFNATRSNISFFVEAIKATSITKIKFLIV